MSRFLSAVVLRLYSGFEDSFVSVCPSEIEVKLRYVKKFKLQHVPI